MTKRPSFIDRCLAGECDIEEIDEDVDRWHEGGSGISLGEFLGMTPDEYALWVEDGASLPAILYAHRFGKPIEESVGIALAARGASPQEIHRVERWLKTRKSAAP